MKKIYLIILSFFLSGSLLSQKAISNEIKALKACGISFQRTALLQFETADIHRSGLELEGIKRGTVISINKDALQALLHEQSDFIQVAIPTSERSELLLSLKRHDIFTSDFKLYASSEPSQPLDYVPGLHYKGIVEGDPSSLVAVSVFKNEVMAMIATDKGNFNLGRIEDDVEGKHIFYNDRYLEEDFLISCSSQEESKAYTEEQLQPLYTARDVEDCVRVYFEINDDIVAEKGGAIPAADYMMGIINQVITIYDNENINMMVSEMLLWDTPSPYQGSSAGAMLNSFRQFTEAINGDLGHLVSFDSIFGGTASISGICNSNPDASKCFSGMTKRVRAFPVYSASVFVIAHEMGHLMGSGHTHSCIWNGNGTSIDACGNYPNPSPCPGPFPPYPSEGGTIMSYCHGDSGNFINFNLGFGPQPGNVIRNSVHAASNCLSPCGQPDQYCESNGANGTNEYIKKVVLGNFSNQSENNNGYANFTSLSASINAGTTYTISLTPNFTGGNKTKFWRVWMDINQDYDWYDAGEIVAQGSGNNTINLTFTIPLGTPSLSTRMRVSMKVGGFPSFCGSFPLGEVEDYTIVIIGSSPSCTDGIQNQNETGIDCGGLCPACPTCTDGIQNQNEIGVDCGGICPACPTCTDGIQNQNETGIDCGGPCPSCPPGGEVIILASYFETGWDSWIDGGSDVNRVNSTNSYEGLYSIKLADNAGTSSAMTSPSFNLSDATGLEVSFHYYASSMENGEDFWVRYNNGSGTWTTIATLTAGTNFNNGQFYTATITVPNFTPTAAGSIRIQCDAGDNNDLVFIDAVIIKKFVNSPLIGAGQSLPEGHLNENIRLDDYSGLFVYPNPVDDLLHIDFTKVIQAVRIIGLDGRICKISLSNTNTIDVQNLPNGIYLLSVQSDGTWITSKFIKM